MASKAVIIKFEKVNKAATHNRIGHTRTGACTSKGKCFHSFRVKGK